MSAKENESSISGRLEALLDELDTGHDWQRMEERILQSLKELPSAEETGESGWLYWLFFAGMLGVVAMGLLRLVPRGHLGLDRMLPAAGCALMMVSSLGLVWAARGGIRPGGEKPSGIRWLMIAAAWGAVLAGSVIALLPLAEAERLPGGVIPFLILLAVSGLIAGLAQEVRHCRDRLALPMDDVLRRAALVFGVLSAMAAAVMETWFIVFY